jgi:hypothetical protein
MPAHDTILAIMQAGVSLAALLLIFSGFLFARAASFETRRGEAFRRLARCSLLPVLMSLAVSGMSIFALDGMTWATSYLMSAFGVTLLATAAFAIIGIFAAG